MLEMLTGKSTVTMKGGELLARMLAKEGVRHVFGIIDGTYFGFYSSFKKLGIELLTPRHETCAAHMAGAYARTTGKLGVCMASNGPGVANILPGVAVENAEGNRVLLVTSARRQGTIDPDRGGTYQSFPQVEVTAPMSKWSVRVPEISRLAEITRKALRLSWKGRPGVVHLDVPESIMNGTIEVDPASILEPSQYRSTAPLTPDAAQVARAADMLVDAAYPIIHAGSGVIHAQAYQALARIAERLHAPVLTSWAARGVVTESWGYAVPMTHVRLNHKIRNEADAVLVLGSRLGETDWWGKAPYWAPASKQKMIQVDVDEETIGVNRPVDLAIVADAKAFLERLLAAVEERAHRIDIAQRRKKIAEIQEARAADRKGLQKHLDDRASPLNSAHVAATCSRLFPEDAVIVLDGGNTAIWGSFYSEVKRPGPVLSTWKFGMLGAGVAQTLGAAAAVPGREVYCVIGDGAMGFHPQEIETAVRHKLKVVYLVLCDKQWGMVKMNQMFTMKPIKTLVMKTLSPEETHWPDLGEIRFDDVARAMGAHGERVSSPEALAEAVKRCREKQGPSVIHVDVDPVKHMWAPGLRDFKDMHAEPEGSYSGSC